jgi:predicted ABC-type ATPase
MRGESFVFETVLPDPAGEKPSWMDEAADMGYTVVVCYVGLPDARVSDERVAMRVSQGGHDVPSTKLKGRFRRSLANLRRAPREVEHALVFDNGALRRPVRFVAAFGKGRCLGRSRYLPAWFATLVRGGKGASHGASRSR